MASSAIFVLIFAIVAFALEIRFISAVNGWWLDEYISLYATDPALTFGEAFMQRFKEPNPPLYYTALFWIRHLFADEATAVVFLNIGAIGVGLIVTFLASAKSKTVAWWVAAAVAFMCNGATLRYVIEARTYLMALAAAFVVSWLSALAIEVRDKSPSFTAFALAGLIAGLTHLYTALVCCCFAVGLLSLALAYRRRDLMLPAIALGLSAGIASVGLVAWVMDLPLNTWIPFTFDWVFGAYSEFAQLALGSGILAALFLALFGTGLLLRPTRPLAVAFGSAWALFALIPLAASLKQPMIVGRYLLIVTPSFLVFVIFLMRGMLTVKVKPLQTFWYRLASFACLAFLFVADANTYFQARKLTSEKSIWRGAGYVAAHVANCPAGSVHVYPGVIYQFAAAAHAPVSLFVNAEADDTHFLAPVDLKCPVLGWAEHIFRSPHSDVQVGYYVLNAPAEELLRVVKINASPPEVNIVRHWSGFVVTRR